MRLRVLGPDDLVDVRLSWSGPVCTGASRTYIGGSSWPGSH